MRDEPTHIFPARQSLLASEAIARLHRLDSEYVLNIEQNPDSIDAGAFHNDVVSVINENVMLVHELAFLNQREIIKIIKERYQHLFGQKPHIIEVSEKDVPLREAVSSYIFNSQLLSKDNGKMLLFAPNECLENEHTRKIIENIVLKDKYIDEAQYFNISESMANGGGPACLRLRIVLNEKELASIKQGVIFSESLYQRLKSIIEQYYVDRFELKDLFDQKFLQSTKEALDQISEALDLGALYNFQRETSPSSSSTTRI
ncbi:MAG TPA: N-succinylarginine dihydrolase [Myxococcota bacterium]|nr:N-succinylarginine dihydrolase [Myxococcota bacterium]